MRTHKGNKLSPRISPTLPSTALGGIASREALKAANQNEFTPVLKNPHEVPGGQRQSLHRARTQGVDAVLSRWLTKPNRTLSTPSN